jgi:hypothetical protein
MTNSSSHVRYDNIVPMLISSVPELAKAYEAEARWWGGETPGPHIVYGDVLNPYIDRSLDDRDDAALHRVFDLVETLAMSDDVHVQEVVAFTICEHLREDPRRLQLAERYMGVTTLRICHDLKRD